VQCTLERAFYSVGCQTATGCRQPKECCTQTASKLLYSGAPVCSHVQQKIIYTDLFHQIR